MHCQRFTSRPISRREMLAGCASGFGLVALSSLLAENSLAIPAIPSQFLARARSVIFLYMDGGVSQVDSFDPKPRLTTDHGKPFPVSIEPTQFDNVGTTFACPWRFAQHGDSGLWISDLFPHLARSADRLCVERSMTSEFSEHNTANYFLHTGFSQAGRPSMGAWLSYGLGSVAQDLPDFIVINGGLIPSGGMDNFRPDFSRPSTRRPSSNRNRYRLPIFAPKTCHPKRS